MMAGAFPPDPKLAMPPDAEIPRLTEALHAAAPRLAELGAALFARPAHAHVDGIDAHEFAARSLPLAALDAALGASAFAACLPPALQRSVRSRQLGWIGGRLCAEHALAALGHTSHGVPRGDGGEPLWPAAVAGSITHTDAAAHALVVRRADCAGVGIDSEHVLDTAAQSDVASVCCSAAERAAWLDGSDALVRTTIVFAAKESFYKAAYPSVRRFIDFDEVDVVAWNVAGGTLVLRCADRLAPPGTLVTAHYRVDGPAEVHARIVLDATLAARLR